MIYDLDVHRHSPRKWSTEVFVCAYWLEVRTFSDCVLSHLAAETRLFISESDLKFQIRSPLFTNFVQVEASVGGTLSATQAITAHVTSLSFPKNVVAVGR